MIWRIFSPFCHTDISRWIVLTVRVAAYASTILDSNVTDYWSVKMADEVHSEFTNERCRMQHIRCCIVLNVNLIYHSGVVVLIISPRPARPFERISVTFESQYKYIRSRNYILKPCRKMAGILFRSQCVGYFGDIAQLANNNSIAICHGI